jgi:hypothetical protein
VSEFVMSGTIAILTKKATRAKAEGCREWGKDLPVSARVMRVVRALWPAKADLELAATTGASERMCRYWLKERYGISLDAVAALLHTEHGLEILEQIMGDERPKWWRRVKRSARLSQLRHQQEQQRRAIEQLELELGADD